MEIQFNEDKFKELILYIAKECENDLYFGATKLNKILFFSDILAYSGIGQPITGAEYMSIEHGPVPKRMRPIREEMLLDGDIKLERRGSQERTIALRSPTYEFSERERKIVDNVIDWLRSKDAESVSELSHQLLSVQAGWAETVATGKNSIIPYDAVFVSNQPPTEKELAEGLALARSHGWTF